MARFDMSGLDETIREMRRMGESSGALAKAMLQTGAERVKTAWRSSAEAHELRDTGDMIESIGFARDPVDIGGALSIDIYPQGKDRKGVRNAEKAFMLHYGTSHVKATRWVDDADAICEDTVVPAMQAVFDEFVATGRVPEVALTPDHGKGGSGVSKVYTGK